MGYPDAAWERAMTVQEVMLKAVSGEIHWFRAADILGWSPRTLRRWRVRYEEHGYAGVVDRRWLRPSKRRIPAGEVERVLRLYRERYSGFTVRQFHQIAQREHGMTVSYSFVKQLLQAAKLVKKHRARGRHRRRREPRACLGEMLHLDGSVHEWFTLAPAAWPCLIVVSDDATKRVFHAAFYPSESTWSVMTSLAAVLRTEGLPMALYTDRAHWAFHTPTAKGPVDKTQLTQVGRALARLGIEHIPSYSPQARGRSERLNRTLQDRLVNELRVAGIATLEAPIAISSSTSCRCTMRPSRARRAILPVRSYRWARSTSTRSSVVRTPAWSRGITRSRFGATSSRWRPSLAAAVAPGSGCASVSISTGGSRSREAPGTSGRSPRRGSRCGPPAARTLDHAHLDWGADAPRGTGGRLRRSPA